MATKKRPLRAGMTRVERKQLQDQVLKEMFQTLVEHTEHMRSISADVQMMRIAITKAAYFRTPKARRNG